MLVLPYVLALFALALPVRGSDECGQCESLEHCAFLEQFDVPQYVCSAIDSTVPGLKALIESVGCDWEEMTDFICYGFMVFTTGDKTCADTEAQPPCRDWCTAATSTCGAVNDIVNNPLIQFYLHDAGASCDSLPSDGTCQDVISGAIDGGGDDGSDAGSSALTPGGSAEGQTPGFVEEESHESPSGTPSWVFPMAIIGLVAVGILLLAVLVLLNKRRRHVHARMEDDTVIIERPARPMSSINAADGEPEMDDVVIGEPAASPSSGGRGKGKYQKVGV